jgi:PPIC-type PPIASE domain
MGSLSRLAVLLSTGVFLAAADAPPPAAPAPAPAAPPSDIVAQRGDVKLTIEDIKEVLSHADPTQRDQLLANPQVLQAWIKERMVRQILLAEARAAKFDQDPNNLARTKDVADNAMAQLWLASRAKVDPAYPSQAELQAAYDANKARFVIPAQFHVQQIAILVPANASKEVDAEALKKAKEARAALAKPKADFAELAKKLSQDPNSASKGGDLGWLREDQILKPVRDVLAGLQENAISEPVRGPDSYHIVKLLGTKPQSIAPLEQVKAQLVAALRQARAQQETNAYLEALLKAQAVQLNDIGLADRLKAAK